MRTNYNNFLFIIFIYILITNLACFNQSNELEIAQSKNIEFLINKGKSFWEQRSDSNAVKKANYFFGQAINVEKNNIELSTLYSQSLFFEALFLEKNQDKKDSLLFKGSQVAKNSILNDNNFSTILNKIDSDSNFKIISALSIADREFVPRMYWWATNKLWYLNNKPAIERVNQRELLEVIMHRVITLEPEYLYGGPFRFFGVFYTRIPGIDISQSKIYFEKAIKSYPDYLGNRVQMAEFYHQKTENRDLFQKQLKLVLNIDPTINPKVIPENIFYQHRASNLLDQEQILFE